ncbi:MAG: alkaline phosphatase family protein, partial [Bacteroidia bacterium]
IVLCCLFISAAVIKTKNYNTTKISKLKNRIVIIMFDGFGMNYYNNSEMPYLKSAIKKGFLKQVNALMPTVTNANNTSICTGTFPETNGITGNTFLDENGHEEYMEDKKLVLAPTIFQTLKSLNIRSALIASKKKSVGLLSNGADIVISPEIADTFWTNKLGIPVSIYSADINYWSMKAGLYLLENRKDIECLYIHTTDYPMHMWAPQDSNSLDHLKQMDLYIKKINEIAPDAMILITADHDVNHKNLCVDIERSLKEKGITIKTAISAEKDKYLKHHRGFGGASYVYLNNVNDKEKVTVALYKLKGIEKVYTREEAAKKYHLMDKRIGDLVVLADSMTVFGILENVAEEKLPATYRSHGSEYELKVPIIILNATKIPEPDYFIYNKDLTSWLFEKKYHSTIFNAN